MSWVVSKKKADYLGKRSHARAGQCAAGPQAADRAAARRSRPGAPRGRPADRRRHAATRRRATAPAGADARPRHVLLPVGRAGPELRAGAVPGRPRADRQHRAGRGRRSAAARPWSPRVSWSIRTAPVGTATRPWPRWRLPPRPPRPGGCRSRRWPDWPTSCTPWRVAGAEAGVYLSEASLGTQVNLRVRRGTAAAAAVERALGTELPAATGRRPVRGERCRAGARPGRVPGTRPAPDTARTWSAGSTGALGGDGAVVDVSAARTMLRMAARGPGTCSPTAPASTWTCCRKAAAPRRCSPSARW